MRYSHLLDTFSRHRREISNPKTKIKIYLQQQMTNEENKSADHNISTPAAQDLYLKF